MTAPDPTPDPAVDGLAEPLLIGSIRRMAERERTREVRIINGSGTTVGGFVSELDDYLAARDAAQQRIGAERALREAADEIHREARYLYGLHPSRRPDIQDRLQVLKQVFTDRADRIAGSSQSGEGFIPITCGTCGESVPNPEFEVHECQADIRNSGMVTDRADRIAQEEA